MAKKARKAENCGTPLDEHILKNYSGGIGSGFNELTRLKVKCPAAGCSFECNTFGEMNAHMKNVHPELC